MLSHEMIMTIEFDSSKSKSEGTFVASVFSFLWLYRDGVLVGEDRAGTLCRRTELQARRGDRLYRDTIEFVGEDERTLTSHVKNSDGSSTEFMQAN